MWKRRWKQRTRNGSWAVLLLRVQHDSGQIRSGKSLCGPDACTPVLRSWPLGPSFFPGESEPGTYHAQHLLIWILTSDPCWDVGLGESQSVLWFLNCGPQIQGGTPDPFREVLWGQNYFYNNTKMFVIFTVWIICPDSAQAMVGKTTGPLSWIKVVAQMTRGHCMFWLTFVV